MNTLTKNRLAASLACIALIAPAAAFADEGADTVVQGAPVQQSATVSFADLNLATDADIDTLRGRVYRVAKHLCIETGSRDLRTMIEGTTCVKTAVAGAEPQIARATEAARTNQVASIDTIRVRRGKVTNGS